ncbi:crystallin J1A-like [Mizuhopecten yessoensis]|uniref:crystallin J1A-like n=1 Tax=Mizuhopecten yessoensis TaxID=6573 RepID=UPI000B45B05E|nr:crystallin J1A-like [Mizuhopecten yessoensis]
MKTLLRQRCTEMVDIAQRCVGAVVGSLVADAAAMPVHWIYDVGKMKKVVEDCQQKPEFLPESRCPFYSLPTGRYSSYGDQTFVLLKSMVENKGLNTDHYKKSLYERFGPKSAYEIDLGHPRTKDDLPIPGPWRPASLTEFIKNYDEGLTKTGKATDAQADGFSKVAPLVALYAGNTAKLVQEVEKAIRVTQEDAIAVECGLAAASILEKCVLGKSIEVAVRETLESSNTDVKAYIQKAIDGKTTPHTDFVHQVGSSCKVPGNFTNSVHCLLNSNGEFRDTVVMTIVPGGCNCSRCGFVGATLGAVNGFKAIPEDWISKTSNGHDLVNFANQLVGLREG